MFEPIFSTPRFKFKILAIATPASIKVPNRIFVDT